MSDIEPWPTKIMEAFRVIREHVRKKFCISFSDFLRNPLSKDIDWCSPSESLEGLAVFFDKNEKSA